MIRKVIILMLTLGAAGMVALWATTAWRSAEYLYHDRTTSTYLVVGVEAGWAHVCTWPSAFGLPAHLPPGVRPHSLTSLMRYIRRTGPYLGVMAGPYLGVKVLSIPLYVPVVLFAAYPTLAFIRGPVRRRRRRRKGLCVECGYDLTGNVTGVCSECGRGYGEASHA